MKLDNFPALKRLVEEMAFDQGAKRDLFYKATETEISSGSFDVPKLEELALIAWSTDMSDYITWDDVPESERKLGISHDEIVGNLAVLLTCGSANVNDILEKKHPEWALLRSFLDQVFDPQ